jgi:hypothetical protein
VRVSCGLLGASTHPRTGFTEKRGSAARFFKDLTKRHAYASLCISSKHKITKWRSATLPGRPEGEKDAGVVKVMVWWCSKIFTQ